MGRKAWEEVDNERSRYLEKALAKIAKPPLPDLVYALAFPIVRRAQLMRPRHRSIYLLRSHLAHWHPPI